MGTSTLETAYLNGQIIDASHINELTQAILLDFVPRDATGAAFDLAGSLGSVDYSWDRIYGALLIAGEISAIKLLGNFTQTITDNSTLTGANQTIVHPNTSILRLTNVGLTSISDIDSKVDGKGIIIMNDTTGVLTIRNNANILTGSGEDLEVAIGGCISMIYSSGSAHYRIIGGAGGGGVGQKKYVLTNNQTLTNVVGLLFSSTTETSFKLLIEVERVGAATYRQVIEVLGVFDGVNWSVGFGNYVGSDLIQSSITNVQEIILSITSGGQFQYASGNLSSHVKSNLKVVTITKVKA